MPRASVNGIEIEYEELGDPEGPPLLLVMGLGAQMIVWDDELCEALGDRALRLRRGLHRVDVQVVRARVVPSRAFDSDRTRGRVRGLRRGRASPDSHGQADTDRQSQRL